MALLVCATAMVAAVMAHVLSDTFGDKASLFSARRAAVQLALMQEFAMEEARMKSELHAASLTMRSLRRKRRGGTRPELRSVALVRAFMWPNRRLTWTAATTHWVTRRAIPGDLVETGVYTGAATIAMLEALRREPPLPVGSSKRVWACDSFRGLPAPDQVDRAQCSDPSRKCKVGYRGQFKARRQEFESNLARFGVGSASTLRVAAGWFSELPQTAVPQLTRSRIAFLRIDADIHSSTRDVLEALYPLVAPSGIVYVDDYDSYGGCAVAVDEYRAAHNITAPMHPIVERDHWGGNGSDAWHYDAVWWQKV